VVYDYTLDPVTNETLDYTLHLEPTEMRTAPIYTMYFNWSRLIVLGIIPFVMLVYLNAKIYKDIQVSVIRDNLLDKSPFQSNLIIFSAKFCSRYLLSDFYS